MGLSCGLIAVLQAAWLKAATPTTGLAFELQVIGAVLIGGTALTGGEGSIYGTLVGTAILGMVTNGLVLMGYPPAASLLAAGLIVVFAGRPRCRDAARGRTGGAGGIRGRRDGKRRRGTSSQRGPVTTGFVCPNFVDRPGQPAAEEEEENVSGQAQD